MFQSIDKRLIAQSLQRAKINRQVEASQIIDFAEKLLVTEWGERIKKKAKPLYLKNRVLVIAVVSSVLAGDMNIKSNCLVNKINQHFGKELVDRIRLEI